jgi:uncharacterized protein (TIGR02996 family)
MNAQERALLATISAQPAEDGPRLVYADWLEEHGECARSEFIRIQLERAALDPHDPRQAALAVREMELIEQHTKEWVRPGLFGYYHAPPVEPYFEPLDPSATRELAPQPNWCFRRGFPWAEFSAGQFLSWSEKWHKEAPVIQLHIGQDSWQELVYRSRHPVFVQPRRTMFRDLLTSPRLPTDGLGLTLCEESDWEQLAQYGRKLRLAVLHARGDTAFVWHVRELASMPGLTGLSELVLQEVHLTDPTARELANCPFMPRLESLNLRGNHLGPRAVPALTSALSRGRIRALDLSDNPIGDAGVQALAQWTGLETVESLRLEGCELGPRGAAALAGSPHLKRLSCLSLQRNQIRGSGVAALLNPRSTRWLSRLVRLDLCGNRIGGVGAHYLTMAAPHLRRLRHVFLSLDRDDLDNHHVRWLSESFDERLRLDWFESPG